MEFFEMSEVKFVAIRLLATCMIAGLPRSPAEGLQTVPEGEAKRLIEAGQAVDAEADAETALRDPSVPPGSFDAEAFIGRSLDQISDEEIAGLSDADREAVRRAEQDREKPRSGLLDRL
jgi:hypothetical protein